MGKVEIFVRPTRSDDLPALAENMREADRIECVATRGGSPLDAITRSVAVSECAWTGFAGGELAFIGGVTAASFFSGRRVPWLLGTTALEKHPAAFLRLCFRRIEWLKTEFPVLENHVDARNDRTIRWLKRLGFAIHEAEPYGILRRPFYRFSLGMD